MRSLVSKQKCFLALVIFCFLLFITGVVLLAKIFPDIIELEINKNVKLEEDSEQYERFIKLPFPLNFKVYIFKIVNPQEVANGDKPYVAQIGPYVYKQFRRKSIEFTSNSEDTISYFQNELFVFDDEASNGLSDGDTIQIINAPLIVVLQILEQLNNVGWLVYSCVEEIFKPYGYYKLFIDLTVKEYLFEGVKFCPNNVSLRCSIVCTIAEAIKVVHKVEGEDNLRFALFHYKNDTNDGLYTVKRGLDDITTLGHIMRLNNATHTKIWTTTNSTCDEVKGTDSTLYPPRVSKDDVFQIYSTDICRYVEIRFAKETTYKDIPGYLFPATKDTLRSKLANLSEDCFCAMKTKNIDGEDSCYLDGVIDMNPCIGVPVLLSFPHFLWADESYKNNVDGLNADEDLHKTYLTVEPNTGTPLEGVKRIQINLVARPVVGNDLLKKLKGTVLPLVWLEEGVQLNDEYIEKLNDLYFNQVKLVDIVQYTLLSVSAALTIVFGGLYIYTTCF